jgi:hypothetical protein
VADADTGLPGAVVRSTAEVYADSNGNLVRGLHVTLTEEQFDAMRAGYLCPPPPHGCLARQREAFPEKCIEPYCNFNLKRDLQRYLEQAFVGEEDLFPERESAIGVPDLPEIWLPGME